MANHHVLTLLSKKLNGVVGIHMFDTRKEMKKLEQTLNIVESIIEDAELKQLGDDEVYNFVGKVRYLVYVSQDLLDDWFIYGKLKNKGSSSSFSSSSSLFLAITNAMNCVFTFEKFKKIRSLRLKLEKIKLESSSFCLNKRVLLPKDISFHGCGNFSQDDVVFGRELDKEIIMKKLFEKYSGVKVVSIVGIGGIGKTTLAQSVYKDDKVKSQFDTRLWVPVSKTASYLETIMVTILNSLSSSDDDFTSGGGISVGTGVDRLMSLLSKRIEHKKFLLVLDDVWDENVKKWQSLKNSLKNGLPGSSILILTRNKMSAYMMSTTTLHDLQPLSGESAWELFRWNALWKHDHGDDALEPFEDIGRIVSQRCNGVPLALKCLGGLLRTKRTRQEWEDVMESDKWELLEMEPILPALYFCYYSMPPVLKLCLSYTTIFPKAYEIDKGMLIKLWMAEGFLVSSATKDRDPELIGEACFQELVMRSYFNPHQTNKDGEVTCIKMHDLVHDLAVAMSGRSFLEVDNIPFKVNKARHISVLHTDFDSVASSLRQGNHVSTLKLFECRVISRKVSPCLFAHLKFLRVLDLSYLCLEEIPNEVGNLRHLRYLDLSHTSLQSLPEQICDLHLQTLILNHCQQLSNLPDSLGNLKGLRHLELKNTPKLQYFPEGFGNLTDLRTLSKFVIASPSRRKGAKIGELKELNLLQGHLEIRGLKRVNSGSDAMEAELVNKKHLQSLSLNFELDPVGKPESIQIMESVLEALKPYPEMRNNVEVLNYLSSKYPSWMSPPDSDQTQKNMDCIEDDGATLS